MIIPAIRSGTDKVDYFSDIGEETARLIDILKKQEHFLTNNERLEIKDICLNFIRRVGSEDSKKTPAEVAILPEILQLLLDECLS